MAKLLSIIFLLMAASSALVLDPRASAQQQVVDLVNAEHKKAGCKALSVDGRIATAAQKHSADMAARNYLSHVTPEGVDFAQRLRNAGYTQFSALGENLASLRTPAEVVNGWLGIAGHRQVMLDCGFTQTGVGFAQNGAGNKWYWTQDFAKP